MQPDGSLDLRVSAKGSSGVNREQQEEKDQEEKKVKREQRVFFKTAFNLACWKPVESSWGSLLLLHSLKRPFVYVL